MSDDRRPLIDWAKSFVGDPLSHERRGEIILDFLKEEGVLPAHHVLELGCGSLSLGLPLMRYLEPGGYVGVDVNGWLVEAALSDPDVEAEVEHVHRPRWLWCSDFDAAGYGPFQMIVAHSLLSHVSQSQLEQCLANARKVVNPGTVFLASLRLSDEDSAAREWSYPDHTVFRLGTVQAVGWHFGWRVEHVGEYKKRLSAECPSDVHDFIRFTAQPSAEQINDLRVSDEARRAEDAEILELARQEYRVRVARRVAGLDAGPVLP